MIVYAIEPESGISDRWILDHVTPNMANHGIPHQVCLVLGRAMLWRIFDMCSDDLVPREQRRRILELFEDLGVNNLLPAGKNPVRKIPVVVDGYDTEVLMDQIVGGDDVDENNNTAPQRIGLRRQEIRLLASQVTHLRRELADSWVEHERQLQVSFACFHFYYLPSLCISLTNNVRYSGVSSLG